MSAEEEIIGTLTAPSGNLVVLDFGLMSGWSKQVAKSVQRTLAAGGGEDEELEDGNIIAIPGVPRSPLSVVGVRNGQGRWADLWKYVEVKLSEGPTAKVEDVGEVMVERARLMLGDPECLNEWVHEGSLDGKADLAFWGRDAKKLAKACGAKRIPSLPDTEEYGFSDLTLDELSAKMDELGAMVEENDWIVRPDPREHDHHHLLLTAAKEGKHGAGSMVLGKANLFGLISPYGDGSFPVQKCLDASGNLVGVRILLGTQEALETMDELNGPEGDDDDDEDDGDE